MKDTIALPDDINETVDLFFAVREAVFKHVGYVEGWRVFPLDDERESYWRVDATERGECRWADSEEELVSGEGQCFDGEIYAQYHLPKWVYRGEKLTAVVVDTNCDGNIFLMLFDNARERREGRSR